MSLLTQPIDILKLPDHPLVRLLDGERNLIRKIPANEAIHALVTGAYSAHGSKRRVKSLIPAVRIIIRDAFPDRAVFPPTAKWLLDNGY